MYVCPLKHIKNWWKSSKFTIHCWIFLYLFICFHAHRYSFELCLPKYGKTSDLFHCLPLQGSLEITYTIYISFCLRLCMVKPMISLCSFFFFFKKEKIIEYSKTNHSISLVLETSLHYQTSKRVQFYEWLKLSNPNTFFSLWERMLGSLFWPRQIRWTKDRCTTACNILSLSLTLYPG